jgi:transposase
MRSPKRSLTTVEYGPEAVLHGLAERIKLQETVDRHAPKVWGMRVSALVEILVINRIMDPKAKTEIPDWFNQTYLPEMLGVKLSEKSGYQMLTRAYDSLTESAIIDIEMDLAIHVRAAFHLKDDTFLYDLTTTFVEGEGEAPSLRYGHSKDHRPDTKQVSYGLIVGRDEPVPLFHVAFPGNTHDSKTVDALMDRFHDRLGFKGCVVIDRGIVTAENLRKIVDERGHDLVGGLRGIGEAKRLMRNVPLKAYSAPFTVGKETLQAHEFQHEMKGKPRRCVLYWSEVKRARDKKARDKRLRKAEEELGKQALAVAKSKRNRRKSGERARRKAEQIIQERKVKGLIRFKFTGGRGGRRLKFWRDEAVIAGEALEDGKQVLVTTLDVPPAELLAVYRDRYKVENAFRITKDVIRIRPIFNRKEEHIMAHLFICFLAYLLISLLALDLKRGKFKLSALKILERLKRERREVERVVAVGGEAEEFMRRFGRAMRG